MLILFTSLFELFGSPISIFSIVIFKASFNWLKLMFESDLLGTKKGDANGGGVGL